jgi:hypothetical protein
MSKVQCKRPEDQPSSTLLRTTRDAKSELGAIAISRSLNWQIPELERSLVHPFQELTSWLVAVAPSSDFV